jgi:hypothetical protein
MKNNILKHSIVKHWQIHFTVFAELKGAHMHTHTHARMDGWIILGRRMQEKPYTGHLS